MSFINLFCRLLKQMICKAAKYIVFKKERLDTFT